MTDEELKRDEMIQEASYENEPADPDTLAILEQEMDDHIAARGDY